MHIITGLILAALLGKKAKNPLESPLLRLKWPIETKHHLPGRVRFHIPMLVGDDVGSNQVEKQIQQVEGVDSVKANKISGSVIICYQADKIVPELLFAALIRLLGLEEELERTPPAILSKELRNIGKAMNRAKMVVQSRKGKPDEIMVQMRAW